MSLEALHVAHPGWVHGLWLWLLFVAGLMLLERRGRGRLARFVSPALAGRLVEGPARWQRAARLALLALAGLAMVVALMRPQWGERFVAAPRVGAEIMIALDVSRSMLADDARPSRLERAKAEITDLLAYLENDQVGLIAFAGRASVLSPLTPDKSFLRLALESAGPHSVSRGGTRLAEPILRAVAGLGRPGPAQRALILITDGEDHDSFALDAARQAAEAGIKIITIGFGDEAGTPLYVRNPEDGSRSLVRDADGNPVVSRLDGELLREIALATDGAYVPAGTGVLDLASIYDAHIARLTRGQLEARGRTIRGETHPIFVATALLALVGAVSVTAGRRARMERTTAPGGPRPTPVVLPLLLGASLLSAALAMPARAEPEADPRVRFNRANERLAAGDAAEASVLYREARRDATDDHALRYAASYNLGMAAVAQADALEHEKPAEALALLHEAADWFREASAMRPGEDDPRHNLEVALRRALILADAIARRERRDVEAELDRLIEAQRAQVSASAVLLEAVARAGETASGDALVEAYDAAATGQRERLAEAETVGDRVADEQAILATRPEAERSPEEILRGASLEGVLAYLDQAVERMGQTRVQLRRRSAERAYRRGAEALALLKRARDQLRDPVEQLAVLMAEVAGVARATAALAQTSASEGDAEVPSPEPEAKAGLAEREAKGTGRIARRPAFLTPEAIAAETAAVAARVEELADRFETAAAQAASSADASAGTGATGAAAGAAAVPGADPATDAEAARLRDALVAAAPLVRQADEAMGHAGQAVAATRLDSAVEHEGEVVARLGEARELFFDLRELLDVAWQTQTRIAAEVGGGRDAMPVEAGPALRTLQEKNRARAERLETLLGQERTRAEAALASSGSEGRAAGGSATATVSGDESAAAAAEAGARAGLAERFERAEALLAEAVEAMDAAQAGLAGRAADRDVDPGGVQAAASRAAERLDALRLLFLSLVERLERLAREQVDLADRTREAIALAATAPDGEASATQARRSALAEEQGGLETSAGSIADALLAQSEAAAQGDAPPAPSGAGPDAETLRRAADLVALSQRSMHDAGAALADAARTLDAAPPAQDEASERLREALALLTPPPSESPPESDGGEQQDEESQGDAKQDEGAQPDDAASQPDDASQEDGSAQEEGGASDSAAEQSDEPSRASGADAAAEAGEDSVGPTGARDPAQLLQGVRDREAERRAANERRARQQRRAAPVEKDW